MVHCVILGHLDCRNKGNEAVITGIINGIDSTNPNINIIIPSDDPEYDRRFLKEYDSKIIISEYWKSPYILTRIKNKIYSKSKLLQSIMTDDNDNVLKKAYTSCMKKAKFVVFSGKDLFCEDYSQWGLDKWMDQLEFATSLNKKVLLWGVSPGPFSHQNEIRFKKILEKVFCISAREPKSYEYIQKIASPRKCYLIPDPAFGIPTTQPAKYSLPVKKNGILRIGFSISEGLIQYRGLNRGSYLKIFADAIMKLNEFHNIEIVLIPHVIVNKNNDDYCISEELKGLLDDINVILPSPDLFSTEYKYIIETCDCFIGTRTHTIIASLSAGIPTVSIAYSVKSYGIIENFYGDLKCLIDIKELNSESLISSIDYLISNSVELRKKIQLKASKIKQELAEGWLLFHDL